MRRRKVGDVIEEGPWAGFELIHRYTREQALEDGVLVDVTDTAREAGFTIPVAVTAAVWNLIRPTRAEQERWAQDEQGRLWDALWMCRLAIRRSDAVDELAFTAAFQTQDREGFRNRLSIVALKAHSGPGDDGEHVLTVMFPHED